MNMITNIDNVNYEWVEINNHKYLLADHLKPPQNRYFNRFVIGEIHSYKLEGNTCVYIKTKNEKTEFQHLPSTGKVVNNYPQISDKPNRISKYISQQSNTKDTMNYYSAYAKDIVVALITSGKIQNANDAFLKWNEETKKHIVLMKALSEGDVYDSEDKN